MAGNQHVICWNDLTFTHAHSSEEVVHLCMVSINLWGDEALGFFKMGTKACFFCQLFTLNMLMEIIALSSSSPTPPNTWFPIKNDWENWKYKWLSKCIFIENKIIFIFIQLPTSCTEEIIQQEILLTRHYWHITLCVSYLPVSELASNSEASPSWQVVCSVSSQLVNWR